MKAIVCTKYGPPEVLKMVEVYKPTPKKNELLVRVRATTVTIGDVIIRSGRHPDSRFYTIMMHLAFGLRKPRKSVLGFEIAGEVESVGNKVTRYSKGDRVFGSTFWAGFGGYAEYKCLPENTVLTHMPDKLTFEEASAGFASGGLTALSVLRKARIQPGQKALINGASGGVGTFAVPLAKVMGAEVTGVCSTANLELVRSLGAENVIDYTRDDFTQGDEKYDVIFDAVSKVPPSRAKRALKKTGIYLNVLRSSGGKAKTEDLVFLKELIEAGKLSTVIDKRYSLEKIVEAHRYVEKGHKKGNVVVTVGHNRDSCPGLRRHEEES